MEMALKLFHTLQADMLSSWYQVYKFSLCQHWFFFDYSHGMGRLLLH